MIIYVQRIFWEYVRSWEDLVGTTNPPKLKQAGTESTAGGFEVIEGLQRRLKESRYTRSTDGHYPNTQRRVSHLRVVGIERDFRRCPLQGGYR